MPTARVIAERCGCRSASSGVRDARCARARRRASGRSSAARGTRRRAVGRRASHRHARTRRCPAARVDERRGDRRSHPCRVRIGDGALPDAAVRLGDQIASRLSSPRRVRPAVLEQRPRSDPGGDLTRPRAAHPVGDGEERRLADEYASSFRRTPAPGVGHAQPRARSLTRCTCSSVAPIADHVAGLRRAARARSVAPLTNVPFVEPRSSTHAPSRPRLDARVTCGRELVAVEPDAASRRPGRRPSRAATSIVEPSSCSSGLDDDEQAARRSRPCSARSARRLGGAEDDALLRRACRCPSSPMRTTSTMKHVEQDEERDLEDQQRLVGLERDGRSRRQRAPEHDLGRAHRDAIAVAQLRARSVRLPLTSTPFVEPRSTIQYAGALLAKLGVAARDVDVRDAGRRTRASDRDDRSAS